MRKMWQKILLLCVACVIYMQGLCLAEVAPNEVLTGVNTANTTINELVNEKPLFIIFGPTYAEPFVRAMSTIETMYKKYGNQLNFAAILVDDQTSAATAFVQSRRLTVPVYTCDSKKIKKDYNLQVYPLSFFVAPDGTILGKEFGNMAEQRWDNFLSRNLETLEENMDAPEAPEAPNDRRSSGDLRSLIYVPRQSQTATLAFSQYDWDGLAEVYRNPYKDGGEFVIINTYIAEDGKTCFSPYRNGFDYIPDDPEDPGAGGEFLFTGGYMREDELDRYYMRARVEGETIKVEWLIGDRQSGPQRREKDVLYPEDTYGLQPVTDAILDKGFFSIKNMSYRFVSNRGIYKDDRCVLNDDYAPAIATMFAFLDFLNEGNTLDSIVEPPPGITLPSYGRLKQPELYRKPTLTF